jgi:hypothetical protein
MSRPHTLRPKPVVTAGEIRSELIRISRRHMLARGAARLHGGFRSATWRY